MGGDFNAFFCKCGNADCACGNNAGGDSSGKMSAATVILESVIFALCGIIRMAGSCGNGNFGIILAFCVFVADKDGNGGSGGSTVKNTA